VYKLVGEVAATMPRGSRRMPDALVVLTYLYAAYCSRPVSWAVVRAHWPLWSLRWVPVLPSSTTMSRRMRTDSVRTFVAQLLRQAQGTLAIDKLLIVDGTRLLVGRHSKDRHATTLGPRAGFRRGYLLHQLIHASGRVVDFRVTPLTVAEPTMALRMVMALPRDPAWYLLGDANYDTTPLHRACLSRGVQMLTPRKRPGAMIKARHPSRRRSILAAERPAQLNGFMDHLFAQRWRVERFFGNLDSYAQGLGELPSWIRGPRRVINWVTAKLVLNALRMAAVKERAAA
jgi:hypothetical protein